MTEDGEIETATAGHWLTWRRWFLLIALLSAATFVATLVWKRDAGDAVQQTIGVAVGYGLALAVVGQFHRVRG